MLLTKLRKIKYAKKISLLVAVMALLFFNFITPSYAQYYLQDTPIWHSPSFFTNSNNTNGYDSQYGQIAVTTAKATSIDSTSAMLNGLINGNNLYNTYHLTTWFEYGTNINLGYPTLQKPSNSGYANFTSNVSGLNPDTIYYFRAVVQTPQGFIYGMINSFRTAIGEANINTNLNSNERTNPVVVNIPPAPAKKTAIATVTTTKATNSETKDQKQNAPNTNVSTKGAYSFFPVTILGWILLIILVLIAILTIKHIHLKFSGKKNG